MYDCVMSRYAELTYPPPAAAMRSRSVSSYDVRSMYVSIGRPPDHTVIKLHSFNSIQELFR